jgi:hypothetical protein
MNRRRCCLFLRASAEKNRLCKLEVLLNNVLLAVEKDRLLIRMAGNFNDLGPLNNTCLLGLGILGNW